LSDSQASGRGGRAPPRGERERDAEGRAPRSSARGRLEGLSPKFE
jgi:hypothetical protein